MLTPGNPASAWSPAAATIVNAAEASSRYVSLRFEVSIRFLVDVFKRRLGRRELSLGRRS